MSRKRLQRWEVWISGLAALLAWVGYYLQPSPAPPAAPLPQVQEVHHTPAPKKLLQPEPSTPAAERRLRIAAEVVRSPRPLLLETGQLPYEAALASIRRSGAPEDVKARALFQMLPRLPEEALTTTAEEAAHGLPNAEYAQVASPALMDPHTHGAVLMALMADLMERPNAITLPTLRQIASNPAHPFAASARDNLALLLGHNWGDNWPAWDQAIRERLGARQ